ncbi:MAG: CHAT domain-containing protein [Cyclobacteriaceae bacterium]|nr:CHAT domain-containing protein [Cyclobacteriaceae bacterium]
MRSIVFLLVLFVSAQAMAQDWGGLLKGVKKEVGNAGAKKKAQLDSIDFQLAMSVNENAGFFDVDNKGEGGATAMYMLKERSEKTDSEIARDTLAWATFYYNRRWFQPAQLALDNARSYMINKGLQRDISYLKSETMLGVVYLLQGRTEKADSIITVSLENTQSILGEKSVGYAANLNSRAKLEEMSGKYNDAERDFETSAQILKGIFKENSMQYAVLQNNKAMLYQTLGRYPQAVELMKEAIKNSEVKKDDKSFDTRRFQSNLAYLYQLSGDYVQAESILLTIKKTFENRLQTVGPEYAALLNQLGVLYIQTNKYDQSEPLLKKSAELYKKKFTEESPSFAKVQNDLGTLYRVQGKFPEAEAAFLRSIAIRKSVLGENHPDYVKSVDNLGILYWKKGDLTNAYTYFSEAMTKSLDFINQYFPPMSEVEKTKYWDILQPRFQRFYGYAVEASVSKPEILKDVMDYQITTKALLLNSTNKIKKAILESKDKQLIEDYLSWIGQKEALAKYYSLSKSELNDQKIDIKALEQQANASEKALSQRSGDFSKAYSSEKISYKKVAGLLGETEALVEIIRVRSFDKDFTDQSRYVALILTKGLDIPKMVVLDNGSQMETKFAKYYKNAIIQRIADQYSYEQYWSKIDPLLVGKKMIYFSPDGVYNQMNINTLKKTDGDYVGNRFDVVTIGNSKDIIALKSKKAILKKTAFVLGFPDYGGAAVALPGTKAEVENLAKILKLAGYTVSLSEQKEANEAKIKAVKGPALMHIATHGYFLADTDIGTGNAMGIDAENAKNNPLLRSGLILSGAPDPGKQQESSDLQSNDNGILTAYEAMNLSLEGTDLIVLSACETGLGDVRAGEGVYGLQRAFLVAGANALIMSLWKVDDAATQMLMTNFYNNWTKSGNKLKAFKLAQTQLMVKYKDPYYWGAFVMMGM